MYINQPARQKTTTSPLVTTVISLFLLFFQLTGYANQETSTFKVNVYGSGNPIILIPGLMSDERVWLQTVEALSSKYQIHTINIAGFGSTPKVTEFSLSRVKQDLVKYIQHSKLNKPVIIGHSLGGFMGFWLSSSHPDLIGPVISVDGLPFIGPVFTQTNQSSVESLANQATQIKSLYEQITPEQMTAQTRFGIERQATKTIDKQTIIDMASLSDPKTVGNAVYTLLSTDLRNDISQIKNGVLLLGASGALATEKDKLNAQQLYREQLSSLPNAKLMMNSHARHFIMLDNHNWLLRQIVNFLENQS